ncbi:DUF2213 domain-containing protein [Candidatus Enterovibrio escicola]|uniref:DUF2213 domain-containing protein n=1 Tax=Candidatus Enterovibrio escicola TaxID=1927127 RepID=UPI001237E56E|nr:DUF2213 domain-containing protein [Candidatus Enterovibrio escacola]
MHTNSVMLFANVNRSQIDITDTHYNIKSIPITVDDSVMNGVHYDKCENARGMPSIKGQPVTLGHPRVEGVNVSGKEGKGLEDYFSGGTVTNRYNIDGVWYADVSIKKSLLAAQDNGERYINALESKSDIGVSTGLMFDLNDESGKNEKGQKYNRRAINQKYDHLAMLLDEAPAGGDATVMRFNSENVDVINVNELIESKDISQEQEQTFASWLLNKIGSFAQDENARYNETDLNTNSGNSIMNRDEMLALLGLATNSQITDDELKTIVKNKLATNASEHQSVDIAEVVANALKPITDELTSVKVQLTANADAEKEALTAQVVALNVGLDETAAKALSADALKSVLTANSQSFVNGTFNAGGHQVNKAEALGLTAEDF